VKPVLRKARALECQRSVGEAVDAYKQVLVMEPGCEEAILRMKEIYPEQGYTR
jgi:hypothetical protein